MGFYCHGCRSLYEENKDLRARLDKFESSRSKRAASKKAAEEEIRDLKARLKAARLYAMHPHAKDPDNMEHWTVAHARATDPRNKNWRKP